MLPIELFVLPIELFVLLIRLFVLPIELFVLPNILFGSLLLFHMRLTLFKGGKGGLYKQ